MKPDCAISPGARAGHRRLDHALPVATAGADTSTVAGETLSARRDPSHHHAGKESAIARRLR